MVDGGFFQILCHHHNAPQKADGVGILMPAFSHWQREKREEEKGFP
jgi:hypothetical protein